MKAFALDLLLAIVLGVPTAAVLAAWVLDDSPIPTLAETEPGATDHEPRPVYTHANDGHPGP